MERRPTPWIEALRHSHDTLAVVVEALDGTQLRQPSYATEWSVAQVLSHLGSQADIFALFLEAGLRNEPVPGNEAFGPIWDTWNARTPEEQATEWRQAEEAAVSRFEAVGPEQRASMHLDMFGMAVDFARLVSMRVSEHALHSWDVAVSLDPSAQVAADAVTLLVDTLDQLVPRVGKPDGTTRTVHVRTTDPGRRFVLQVGEAVALAPAPPDDGGAAELHLSAEALVRLVYGRLDAAHTPPYTAVGVDLDELRRLFPGL